MMIELFRLLEIVGTRTTIVTKSRKKIPLHLFKNLSVENPRRNAYYTLPSLLITFYSCHLSLV